MLRSARPAGRLTKALPGRVAAASFTSTTASKGSYEDTIENLKIGSHTRVIFQGFTGIFVPSPCCLTSDISCRTIPNM